VIKIEPPTGDPYRKLPQIKGQPQCEQNYAWLLTDRSRRSLALDLTRPEGQAVLARLVKSADIFITNMPLRVRSRLGIAYDQIGPLNERLIYASFTGYGETGEEASKPGFDSNAYWARSGLMNEVKPHAESPPARSVSGMGDHPAALALYGAIATALYRREKTGKGGHVATSLLANGLWSHGLQIQAKFCGATFTPRVPREQSPNALTNLYRCKDGRWLTLSLLEEERQWPVLLRAVEEVSLAHDPRFTTKAARHEHARELVVIFDHIFLARDFAEWRRRLDAAGLVFGSSRHLRMLSPISKRARTISFCRSPRRRSRLWIVRSTSMAKRRRSRFARRKSARAATPSCARQALPMTRSPICVRRGSSADRVRRLT
jgi:crotonobetainyl-CoA:carnitine CoA-transferase CaiB-like acyl-CoA transferase